MIPCKSCSVIQTEVPAYFYAAIPYCPCRSSVPRTNRNNNLDPQIMHNARHSNPDWWLHLLEPLWLVLGPPHPAFCSEYFVILAVNTFGSTLSTANGPLPYAVRQEFRREQGPNNDPTLVESCSLHMQAPCGFNLKQSVQS